MGGYGWTIADRRPEYEGLRRTMSVAAAAARTGVSIRTAQRYEARLRERGADTAELPCSLQVSLLTWWNGKEQAGRRT